MIKASDVGLEKADYSEDVFADFHKVKERVLQRAKEKQEEKRFNELNIPKNHTVQELIALMTYKGMNIKAHIHPAIFFEVAEMLKQQEEKLQDKIYTEDDL